MRVSMHENAAVFKEKGPREAHVVYIWSRLI